MFRAAERNGKFWRLLAPVSRSPRSLGAIKSVGQSFVSATLTVPLVLLKCDLQSVTFWHCTFGKSV